jgi:hypothetical protein
MLNEIVATSKLVCVFHVEDCPIPFHDTEGNHSYLTNPVKSLYNLLSIDHIQTIVTQNTECKWVKDEL